MYFIPKIIRNFFTRQLPVTVPNGRWKLENCNIKVNRKIDLSNEDHCGPCGQHFKQIVPEKQLDFPVKKY